jgi:hypothetical protein
MSMFMWVLVGAAALAVLSQLAKRRSLQKSPSMSDEEFVKMYNRQFLGNQSRVRRERKFIAKTLGLDYLKLRPDQTFSELSKLTGFLTEYDVGMSDLEAELIEVHERGGLERPAQFPKTVGEFISQLLTAREQVTAQKTDS